MSDYRPRNHHNLHEVVVIRRPLFIPVSERWQRGAGLLGVCGLQHRRQIALQLDSKHVPLRRQDDFVDQAPEGLRSLDAAVLVLQCASELRDLFTVEVGHIRVEQWWRFNGTRQPTAECRPLLIETNGLVPQHRAGDAIFDRLNQRLDLRFDARQLTLHDRDARARRHAEPIHLAREFLAELLEEIAAQQLVLERMKHPRFDVVATNRQVVRADSLVAGAEAREAVARLQHKAAAAHAALRQAREEVPRSPRLADRRG